MTHGTTRPSARWSMVAAFLTLALAGLADLQPTPAGAAEPFDVWLDGVRAEARDRGVSDRILDAALADVTPIPRVIELDRKQPEFSLKFDEYIGRVISDARIQAGRTRIDRHAELLHRVADKYGVQPRFIVALWGIETAYGRITGGFPVIAALATLAHDGRRSKFFRNQLMLALEILEEGHIAPADMQGSWAGAMGQSQFMPSSFHSFAVDHDGDGDKDIWGSLEDVFGSIANYLAKSGWRDDITWGREVVLPQGFDMAQIEAETRRGLNDWQALGVRRPGGGDLPGRNLQARIVMVTERSGRARYFVAYDNFDVILKWNRSTYFAIAVGTLADSLASR